MGKGDQYTDEQLAEMYRHYAYLKGWNTDDETVKTKLEGWRYASIGPVGLAIDFYETGVDNAKHLGRDAEASSPSHVNIEPGRTNVANTYRKKSKGCLSAFVLIFSTVLTVIAAAAAILER